MTVDTSSFAKPKKDPNDPSAAAFQWRGDLVKRYKKGLIQIPEYYRLEKGAKKIQPISVEEVPKESELTTLRFP